MSLQFRKSSYSGGTTANCVEVAEITPAFRKSSYSSSYGNCVEVAEVAPAFRKASYSTSYDNCVEVSNLSAGAAVRDSKYPELGHIPFPAAEWAAFLQQLKGGLA